MKKTVAKTKVKRPKNVNDAPKDYKDPTGSRANSGRPKKNSGYDEKQPKT